MANMEGEMREMTQTGESNGRGKRRVETKEQGDRDRVIEMEVVVIIKV